MPSLRTSTVKVYGSLVTSQSDAAAKLHSGVRAEIWAALAFCTTSIAMMLLNKAVMAKFDFNAPTVLLFMQCFCTLWMSVAWRSLAMKNAAPIDHRWLHHWLPVNLLFVGMLWTSFCALKYLGVAMVTVLKNLTSFLVIAGDYYFFKKRYGAGIWWTLVLMLVSALASAATDLAFDARGYGWQLLNNVFTAAYSLALRGLMQTMAEKMKGEKIDECSLAYFNSLLALPLLLLVALLSGELSMLSRQPALRQPSFYITAGAGAAVGFLLSVSSMWLLSLSTATIFSIIGSLNKIPTAALGIIFFQDPTSPHNILSVFIGLGAGVVFAYAKAKS